MAKRRFCLHPKINLLLLLAQLAVSVGYGQDRVGESGAGFVGAKVCEACHRAEAASHGQTGHARALQKAPPGSPGQWAFGAGKKAITYVSRQDGQHYVEHGLSFYTGRKQMGLTPGHENAGGKRYRTLDPSGTALRCFRCHTTGPISLAGDGAIQWREAGVQCESCHGPGGEHVKKPGQLNILNPRRFTPAALNDFCGDCHRTSADITDWNLSWSARHEPAFLSQSRCFEKAAVSCLTCHSSHRTVEQEAKQYDAKCSACHATPKHRTATAGLSCISCHMPEVPTNASLRFRNHWIGVYDKARPMTPLGRSVKQIPRTGLRSPASPEGLRATYSQAKPWDRGMFLKSIGDAAGAVEALSAAVAERGSPVDLENLGILLGELGRNAEAKALFERAVQGADAEVAARSWAALAGMEPAREKEYYEKALAASKAKEFQVTVLNNLALSQRGSKDDSAAEKTLRRALVLDPNHVGVMSNLGSLLHSAGRMVEAERLERQALAVLLRRTGPVTTELAAVSTNLGDLLLSKGQMQEAVTHFRRALAVDQAVYGSNHPELFIDLMNLGMGLQGVGAAQESQAILRQGLSIAEQHFGAGSPEARVAREAMAARKR